MSTFRTWLDSSVGELRARGGLLAAYLYLVVGMCSLLVITVLLAAILIAAILLAPAQLIRLALDWKDARQYTRNRMRYFSAEKSSKSKPPM